LWRLVEEHPLSARSSPADLEGMARAGARIERFEREIADLGRRVDGVADTVAHRFERLVGLLSRWGYLEGWSLTPRGQLLARCYHECDLLIVESLARGLLDGLDPAAFAALVSCFSYEHRSRTMPQQSWLPSAGTRDAYQQVQDLAARLNDEEEGGRLALTRPPDATFGGLAYAWASGGSLDDVLADEDLSGGDFVRNVKQLIDLCRQLGELAPAPDTAAAARRAAELLYRGVVAASSIVEVPEDIVEVPEDTVGEPAAPEGHDERSGSSATSLERAADREAPAGGRSSAGRARRQA
jgi:ATP-dependent RNA helicase HelY